MKHVIEGLKAERHAPHRLHSAARDWPETNCYTDLWIEVLHALGLPPEAMLGVTLRQDFEGDQFTFFKTCAQDLEQLFGICVGELAIFDTVERHALAQIERGRLVLVEVDSFWLPDTLGVSYRQAHAKTTIGINGLDPHTRRLSYFHNGGYFEAAGDDYEGLFRAADAQTLFPYVEFVKFPQKTRAPSHTECESAMLRHLAHRPAVNPFRAWQAALPAHLIDLAGRPPGYFHAYAFNTLRQVGANFELLAAHLEWMSSSVGLEYRREVEAAQTISKAAKAMQFQLARAMTKRKFDSVGALTAPMADAWDVLMESLEARYAARRAA